MTVSLRRSTDGARMPERATAGSFGHDLSVSETSTIPGRATVLVPTGLVLSADLPIDRESGLAMLILPRSSLPLRHGLIVANSPGLIDADYAGEIKVPIHNLQDEPVTLERGTRIAQLVFARLYFPPVAEVTESDPARSRGGFGSTG